jgi:hypothetical protein
MKYAIATEIGIDGEVPGDGAPEQPVAMMMACSTLIPAQ